MNKKSNPILVTGSHRSGSTWTGRIMAAAPHVGYIHEPFNIGIRMSKNPRPFKYWFEYICGNNSGDYDSDFNEIINYRYPLRTNIKRIRTAHDFKSVLRDQSLSLLHKLNKDRPLIKDPIAVLSAEWLCTTFNMNVLVLIRHPAAFCSSLKIKNWRFDFNNFLNQPLLMGKHLSPFEEKINTYAKNEKNIIKQAVLLWNCIHHVIRTYQEKHPEWIFMRHEDLSTDPIRRFHSVFRAFDLEFSQKVKKRIHETSGEHNPVEQHTKKPFIRNSKENIYNWKKRLTPEEILLIRRQTSEISGFFYTDDEW